MLVFSLLGFSFVAGATEALSSLQDMQSFGRYNLFSRSDQQPQKKMKVLLIAQTEEASETPAVSAPAAEAHSEAPTQTEPTATEPTAEEVPKAEVPKKKKKKRKKKKRKKKKKRSRKPVDVTWYQPEFSVDKDEKGNVLSTEEFKVTLIGKTMPKARLYVGKTIFQIEGQKLTKISRKKILRDPKLRKFVADENGFFSIPMYIPEGHIQIPIVARRGKRRSKMRLLMDVTEEKALVKDAKILYYPCTKCLWLGVGFGVLAYQQEPPEALQPIEYGSLSLPNLSFRGIFKVGKKFNARFDFHQLKGDDLTASDSSIAIVNPQISWTYFGLEGEYLGFSRKKLLGKSLMPGLLFGVQSQNVPFVLESGATSFTIGEFSFYSLSLGASTLINPEQRWQYEMYLRLQIALSSSGDVTLTGGYAFDGSIGAIYNITQKWKLGIFWNGQLHNYNYSLNSKDGTYTLFSSNLDFSIGYSF